MHWRAWDYDSPEPTHGARPYFDSPNEGGPRVCENEDCQQPMPLEWPAVYCSNACALADALSSDLKAEMGS